MGCLRRYIQKQVHGRGDSLGEICAQLRARARSSMAEVVLSTTCAMDRLELAGLSPACWVVEASPPSRCA